MIQIRFKVFETNSSLSHSLVVCEGGEYDKWLENFDNPDINKDEYYLFSCNESNFLSYKEAIKENARQLNKEFENGYLHSDITKEDIDNYANGVSVKPIYDFTDCSCDYYLTRDEFTEIYYQYEIEDYKYTTKSGDKLTIFCYYGND